MKQILPKQIRKINLYPNKKNIYKSSINNTLNKSNLIKSKEDIYLKQKTDNIFNNKNSLRDSILNKKTYMKSIFRNINKFHEYEVKAKNSRKINRPKNFTCDISNSKYIRYGNQSKDTNFEQNNDVRKVILTNAIYDDVKLRNIINLWNELEVMDSYRKYFFFIYNELDEEDQKDLYLNEINELIQLKNDIKNLTYNIELRIGLIKILSELNTELNSPKKKDVDKFVLGEMIKKLEDLTIQTVNIVKYMRAIKTVINQTPNLSKYSMDILALKFNFDKNYIIKMKLETNFLREGCAKDYFHFKNDQSPFFIRANDKNNIDTDNNQNYVISLDQKIIEEIKECNYYIYKELISYENNKIHKTIQRCISPIKKNSSAYNFYTNINFYSRENKSDRLIANMKANGKGFIFNNNNYTYNNNKKDTTDDMGNHRKNQKNIGLLNFYNNNNKNKTLETKLNMIGGIEKKNKNGDFINFQNEYSKQKYIINQSKNESDKETPKFKLVDHQRPNQITSSFRIVEGQYNSDNN